MLASPVCRGLLDFFLDFRDFLREEVFFLDFLLLLLLFGALSSSLEVEGGVEDGDED